MSPTSILPSSHIAFTAAPSEATAGSLLTIDLAALAANYRFLASQTDHAECSAVIKADAYGTGLEQAAIALSEAGCRVFFVAHPREGERVRTQLPDATIYVLNGLVGDHSDEALGYICAHSLRPVLGSYEEIDLWQAYCERLGLKMPCALHFDTGMNRMGLSLKAAHTLSERWASTPPNFEVTLIMSHLACADEPNHPLNKDQLERFRAMRACFPTIPASLANSAGIFLGSDFHFDLLRPGIALYGGQAVNKAPNPMQAVATLESRILSTRKVPKGWSVSYGACEVTKRESRLATLCIGYADGYLRAAGSSDESKGASVWIAGHRAPIFGRVTMDLTIIDITDIPEELTEPGTLVEMFGPNIAVDDVAAHAGTIGYEILTSLGLRAYRRYL